MGKGRKPCCDKAGVKRGPWSQAEDFKLMSFIQKHGHSNWRALPRLAGLARCGKSCRLRWVNYLRPDLKRGNFSPQDEATIIKLHEELGNKWSKIASHFPGRTDNEIKNVWNTHLKKRIKDRESSKKSSESCNNVLPTSSSLTEEVVDGSNKDCLEQNPMNQTNPTVDIVEQSSSSSTSYTSQASFSDHHILEELDPILDVGDLTSNMVFDVDEPITCTNLVQGSESTLEELIEIPFEPNLDLWDLLDGESSSAEYSDVHFNNVDTSLCPISEKDTIKDNDNKKDGGSWWWLVYLENELGLDHNEAISPPQPSAIGSHHE